MIEIFGIGNCDTCRKARKWLESTGRDYRWHDLRADGLSEARLQRWVDTVGLDRLVNRRSSTWRGLDDGDRGRAMDPISAMALLAGRPTLIKRPVIEADGRVLVGFDDSVMSTLEAR
jgi:Spx/MgsR family transcriptional regulator